MSSNDATGASLNNYRGDGLKYLRFFKPRIYGQAYSRRIKIFLCTLFRAVVRVIISFRTYYASTLK